MRLSLAFASAESLPLWPLNLTVLWIIAFSEIPRPRGLRSLAGEQISVFV